jgi:hypothetical protein
MGQWNYRVMRHTHREEEHFFVLHQVYYCENGEVDCWTIHEIERGDYPFGETETELQNDIGMMLQAFDLPVLDFGTGKEIDGL